MAKPSQRAALITNSELEQLQGLVDQLTKSTQAATDADALAKEAHEALDQVEFGADRPSASGGSRVDRADDVLGRSHVVC